MKKRKRKTKTGSSRLIAFVLILLGAFAASPAGAQKAGKQTGDFGVIAGTVFREPGFALPGAEVVLVAAPDSAAPTGKSGKKQKAAADARGEFVFRVPPGPAKYLVTASSKGMKPVEQPVSLVDTERIEVTFMLQRESK